MDRRKKGSFLFLGFPCSWHIYLWNLLSDHTLKYAPERFLMYAMIVDNYPTTRTIPIYREKPKLGNYPTRACPYVKRYTMVGYGSFLFSGILCMGSTTLRCYNNITSCNLIYNNITWRYHYSWDCSRYYFKIMELRVVPWIILDLLNIQVIQ